MTVCNMSIEAGARAGMIAPDDTTFEYLRGRPHSPRAPNGIAPWNSGARCATDAGAKFDKSIDLDANQLEPMITYGTNPGMVMPIGGRIPERGDEVFAKALAYMGFSAGDAIRDKPVNVVFVGSCTNARLSDLRQAAAVLQGPQDREQRAHAGGTRFAAGQARGRGGGPRPGVPRRRRGMARVGLLDVHRHER